MTGDTRVTESRRSAEYIQAIAIACMYSALLRNSVTLVAPVIGTYPVFTLLAALALKEEKITLQIAGGVAVVVAGVVLITWM